MGDNFNPNDLIKVIGNVRIENSNASGEISMNGRFKGQPMPYGYCRILPPENIPTVDRISWMTEFISRHLKTFRTSGATDIQMHIDWTGLQGNMEFTVHELKGIAALGIPMTISYMFQTVEK